MKLILYFLVPLAVLFSNISAQIATSVLELDGVTVDTATFLNDYNGSGTADILEDFDGNGVADAFQFVDAGGQNILFLDYNGDGIPDAFTDFNGSGIPDAFEDYSGSGTPDGFESGFVDADASGIPDFFERIYPSLISSASHPDPRYSYAQAAFFANWDSADFPGMANGWLWMVDAQRGTELTIFNGNYLAGTETGVSKSALGLGLHWFHLVPIDENSEILSSAQISFAFEISVPSPEISSPSHPDPNTAYYHSQFIAQWEAAGAGNVLSGWYWQVSDSANTVLDAEIGSQMGPTATEVVTGGQGFGQHWFHLVGVDAAGNFLSDQQRSFAFTVAMDAPEISSTSHPDSATWYARDRFIAAWTSQETLQLLSGWRWKVAPAGSFTGPLTAENSELLPALSSAIVVPDLAHGEQVFHLAPVDAAGIILNDLARQYSFKAMTGPVQVSSPSHPEQDLAYPLNNVQIDWILPDVDPAAITAYYLLWNDIPTDLPGKEDTRVTSTTRNFFGQADGSHYFHLVAEDSSGNLTQPVHFRVNVHAITGLEAGLHQLDLWKINHFGEDFADNVDLSGDEADPNGDGVPNLIKYFFGEDPMGQSRRSAPVAIDTSAGVLRFERAAGLFDISQFFEYSHDLENWTPYSGQAQRIGTTEAGREIFELTLPELDAASVFWRIKIAR